MSRSAEVWIDLVGEMRRVGMLFAHQKAASERASFEYDASWLREPRAFALDPSLPLQPGAFLFGAFSDAAPDRWGRTLMRRAVASSATGPGARALSELDYLLGVHDEGRHGALRFKDESGHFVSRDPTRQIPPLVQLPKLLRAARHVVEDRESEEDLRLLLAPGSSLGGARPKATVRAPDGSLKIAKFARKDDESNVNAWESVALTLANRAGLNVASHTLELIARQPVVLLDRFDRLGTRRVPFVSAMTLLGAEDMETRSYLEIAEAIRRDGCDPRQDLEELWGRIAFGVQIANVDDHLRNHGFLRGAQGWRLSPAYDLNPTPAHLRPRMHALAIDEVQTEGSKDVVMSVCEQFGQTLQQAKRRWTKIEKAVGTWREVAIAKKIPSREISRMESAFMLELARSRSRGS